MLYACGIKETLHTLALSMMAGCEWPWAEGPLLHFWMHVPQAECWSSQLLKASMCAGFRITACAATPDQAAFVLSVPRRRPMDETQETLRTSAFPSTHVKDKWAKNLYIAGVAYGRTVS